MKLLKVAKSNEEDRMNFVVFWADFVRDNPDAVWGKQHKIFVNAMMQNAKHYPLTVEQYLKIKEEKYNPKR